MEIQKDSETGLDRVESSVATAREKIDSIAEQTKEQYQNWKRVLSGALNDKQLIIALSVLFGFYLFFTAFNTILGSNSMDHNTMMCECPAEHRVNYRNLIILTIVAWVICFILSTIWDLFKFWKYTVFKRSSRSHQKKLQSASDVSSMSEKSAQAAIGEYLCSLCLTKP